MTEYELLLKQDQGFNVSNKYNVISSFDIIQQMERYGFETTRIETAGTRTSGKENSVKHMIRMSAGEKLPGGLRPEVVIFNSYDGTQALKIHIGVFRFVCANSMVTGTNLIPSFNIKHNNNNWESELNNFIDTYEEKYNMQKQWIEQMHDYKMSLDEAYIMAEKALEIRHYDARIINDAVDPLELLLCKRREDKGDTAWHRFNVLQESLSQGQYKKYDNDGGIRKAKILTNVDEILRFNIALSDLFTTHMIK